MREQLQKHKQYLLTGVSYVIPFIACGGILLAISLAFVPMKPGEGPDFSNSPNLKILADIGGAAFNLYLPVLAGFIAFAVAGRPGLVPGMIGGYLCGLNMDPGGPVEAKAGFLGAIIIGLIAGHIANLFKRVPSNKFLRPILPILIIPVVSGLAVGLLMFYWLGNPIAALMGKLNSTLDGMQTGNALVLAAVLGGMIAFDMGGPVNKAAFFFGVSMIQSGKPIYMGAIAAAICTPPLGLGLATLLRRRIWSETERDAGYAALGMGMMGITEGAIPFAVADPFRVIPCIMLGSVSAAVTAMQFGVADHAPHGGPIVLGVVDNKLMYVAAILVGVVVTAISVIAVKSIGRREGVPA